ncbi:MAG: DNA polymerase III subunit gamma/tau [Gammaproteobacteria bacterium]
MSYQVLARKWRPRKFAEMVGQTHVLRALINALDADRLHHAFLFTGTRGVGKTTIARILAKSLNCEQGVSSTPCGECTACREIDEGRFVDLIEVDAASRTKVEDTRELLDNVQYAPTRGRYKVYLIDEVHMLSNHSFNALLKTLEEPPPHVKFLLATTDPQKLPVTILSRCLQFNLRRLPADQIQDYLQDILGREGIDFEVAGLAQLARAADGSMRDALSLLDQAIAFGGGQVNDVEVRSMLGTLDRGQVQKLLTALADGQASTVLSAVNELAEQAPDFEEILAELISQLHYIALMQQVPDSYDESMGDKETLEALADSRAGLEMVLLRMLAFRPEEMSANTTSSSQVQSVKKSVPEPAPAVESANVAQQEVIKKVEAPVKATAVKEESNEWHDIVASLSLGGVDKQLAMNCALVSQDNDHFILALEPASAPMLTKERQARIQDELIKLFGKELRISIEVQAIDTETPAQRDHRVAEEKQAHAESEIKNDSNVQSILEAFNGTVKPNSVQVVDET